LQRTTTRWLILLAIGLTVVPIGLSSLLSTLNPAFTSSKSFASVAFGILVIVAVLAGGVLAIVVAVGTLIQLSHLCQYAWFWVILGSIVTVLFGIGALLTPVLVLIYSFVGPTTPAGEAAPIAAAASLGTLPVAPLAPAPAGASASSQCNGLALVSFFCGLYVLVTVGLTAGVLVPAIPTAGQPLSGTTRSLLTVLGSLDLLNVPAAVTALVTGIMAPRRARTLPSGLALRGFAWIGLLLGGLACLGYALILLLFLIAGLNGF
jgi:hypothetical protein